jgi:hypothetical protein
VRVRVMVRARVRVCSSTLRSETVGTSSVRPSSSCVVTARVRVRV